MTDLKTKLENETENNVDLLRALADAVNSWNGELENLRVYEFDDDFFNCFFDGNVMDAVRATYFGTIDSWSDPYIRFDGYGNLESLSEYEYESELRDYSDEIIECAVRLADEIYIGDIVDFDIEEFSK